MSGPATGPLAWPSVRALTPARIGLARTGASLATAPLLETRLAHARARDAVHAVVDERALAEALVADLARPLLVVNSEAVDRRTYLMRPDLGRRLDGAASAALAAHAGEHDLAVVLGDGLSALAVQRHAAPLLGALMPALRASGWRVAPLVLVRGVRVAGGDQVAQALGAAGVLVLIGERPGWSAPDSLGAYATWSPNPDTTDADRNCVSNIRPEGLVYGDAAHRLFYLLGQMRASRVSGVTLKDESGAPTGLSRDDGIGRGQQDSFSAE